jgi:hypothetical protein
MNKLAAAIGVLMGLTAGVTLATSGTDSGFPFVLYAAL